MSKDYFPLLLYKPEWLHHSLPACHFHLTWNKQYYYLHRMIRKKNGPCDLIYTELKNYIILLLYNTCVINAHIYVFYIIWYYLILCLWVFFVFLSTCLSSLGKYMLSYHSICPWVSHEELLHVLSVRNFSWWWWSVQLLFVLKVLSGFT